MLTHKRQQNREIGQTVVIFALAIVGLIAFVGLAVDGGNVLKERRVTQNAADASALGGVHYIATGDGPTEQILLSKINQIVEANGLPDSDGNPGNAVNDFVVAYYTDVEGERLESPNCIVVGSCPDNPGAVVPDAVPDYALGLEVDIVNPVDTFFLGVIGQNRVKIGADAVAVYSGPGTGGASNDVMIALGDCDVDPNDLQHTQLTGRGYYNEFLGAMHTNSAFESSGGDNHFHGQVTYVDAYTKDGTNTVFEPADPEQGPVMDNPYAGWKVSDFAPGSDIATEAAARGEYFDVRSLDRDQGAQPGIILMSEIINRNPNPYNYPELYNPSDTDVLEASDGLVLQPNQMRSGIYYAGEKEIRIGENAGDNYNPGTNGTITVVGHNLIKITEMRVNFTPYMDENTDYPGLLFFSDYELPDQDPCIFEEAGNEPIIWMAGNYISPTLRIDAPEVWAQYVWDVYHYDDDLPPSPPPPEHYLGCPYPKINGCYKPSNNVYYGVIYAPNGRVKTADMNTTYIGAIVAFSIDYSGGKLDPDHPDEQQLGNLFVTNGQLFPPDVPIISLKK